MGQERAGGRPLLALKISDHPERDEDEPAVLLNGSHHGNELLPVEFTLDAVQQLLEGYARDMAQLPELLPELDLSLWPSAREVGLS